MSASECGRARNVFDALLTFVKVEKDEPVTSCSQVTSSSDDNSVPLIIKPEPVDSLEANAQHNIHSCHSSTRTSSFTTTLDTSHVNNFVNQVPVIRENTCLVDADSSCRSSNNSDALQSVSTPTVTGTSTSSDSISSVHDKASSNLFSSAAQVAISSVTSVTPLTASSIIENVFAESKSPGNDVNNLFSLPLRLSTDLVGDSHIENPVIREYVNQKCNRLRYPPQLALEMLKLSSPSKLPVISTDKSPIPCGQSKSSSRNTQQPDRGYLEIDDSHFSVSFSCLPVKSNTAIVHDTSHPRTKAQMREVGTINGSIETTSEKITSENCNNECRQSEGCSSHKENMEVSTSEVVVVSDDEEICESSEAHRESLSTVRRNKRGRRSQRLQSSCGKRRRISSSTASRLQPTTASECSSMSDEQLTRLKSMSSLDLVGNEDAKLLRMPYCVCTYASQSEKHKMKSHLLLGDVIRVLYLLLTNRKHHTIALQVLKHCWLFCHRVPLADIRLFTLSGGLSSRNSAHLSQYPLVISELSPLFVVRWSSDSLLKGTLDIAHSCLPRNRFWYNCCSERLLQALSRLIFRPDAKKYILNMSKYLSSKCRQISNASSSSSAAPLDVLSDRNDRDDGDDDFELPAPNPVDDNIMRERNLHVELCKCLPESVSCFLRRKIGLDLHHTASFGFLIRSFHNTCLYVLSEAKKTPGCNSNAQIDKSVSLNLFSIMECLHRVISVCLCRLCDSYASLMSAGACLKARHKLANTDSNSVQSRSSMRLARGRARLFESESCARDNVIRILAEEVCVPLRNVLNFLEKMYHTLCSITSSDFLLGPFFGCDNKDTSLLPSKQCVFDSILYTRGLVNLNASSREQWDFETFTNNAFFLLEYLTTNVFGYIRGLCESVFSLKEELSKTYLSIMETWVPAYKEQLSSVSPRADVDLKYFFSSLQSQYDAIEAWSRRQHEVELKQISSTMINFLGQLYDCWKCRFLCDDLKLPCHSLDIPYGSKNSSSQSELNKFNVNALSPWPPQYLTFVPAEHPIQENSASDLSKTVSSTSGDSAEDLVYSKVTFSRDSLRKTLKSTVLTVHTSKVSCSQSERRISRDEVDDANARLLSDRCAGAKSSISHSVNPCSPNIIPQKRLLIAVKQTSSKNVTSMSPNTSSSLDSNSLRTTEVMNSSESSVSVNESTTDKSKLNSSKLVTEIVVDDVSSLGSFPNPLSSGNACNNSPTGVDVACREKGSVRNSYNCGKEVNGSQCSPQPVQVCSPVVSKDSDTSSVVTDARDSCGSASRMSIDSRGESLAQSASVGVSGTTESAHSENFSSDSLMLVSTHSECNESEAQSVPPNVDVDGLSSVCVTSDDVENMSSQPNTAESTEDVDVTLNNSVPSSNSDGILESPGASTNNRNSPLKDSSCQDDHDEESTYSIAGNSDGISESGSQLSSVSTVVSINRKKEKSIKKVCIYLPSNTVANSPTEKIICQCSIGEEHSHSDQVSSCTMTLDRRRAGKLKRKLKKLNNLPVGGTNTSEISETNSTSQIESPLCSTPSTSNSLSLREFPNSSHNLTNVREKQPLSDFVSLSCWLQEKSLNSEAPGPVTASVLGLSMSPLSTISVDLTSDE
ncbi:unnamed protein product [Trichobilharzia szidati]|nr:unnamed protein product [Trichobilharzia szidati]